MSLSLLSNVSEFVSSLAATTLSTTKDLLTVIVFKSALASDFVYKIFFTHLKKLSQNNKKKKKLTSSCSRHL